MALFGSGNNNVNSTTYYSLNIQTSIQGIGVPIVMGANRIGGNLMWYGDFTRTDAGGKGGGKGGGGKDSGNYNYSASLILGICEGPIEKVGLVWSSGSTTTLATMGLTLFTGTESQAPWGFMTSNHPTEALGYTHTAYTAAANYALGSSAQPPNVEYEVFGFFVNDANANGANDVNIAQATYALLTNAYWGLDLPTSLAGDNSAMMTYCRAQGLFISPVLKDGEQVTSILQRWAQLSNTWIFWDGTEMKYVPLGASAITGNGITYTPNRPVIADLNPDHFLVEEEDETTTPITVTISDPSDGYNQMELDINDRSNQYNNTPVIWFDQYLQDLYGNLPAQSISASEVCVISIASTMAALIGKRNAYIRNNYTFRLDDRFAFLLPGDIVTLSEPRLGLNFFPVAITEVSGDDKDQITVNAEEYPQGITNAGVYLSPSNESGNNNPNLYVDPGDTNPPGFWEPTPASLGGPPTLQIALSGGEWWGGCGVYVSFDNVNYNQIGTCTGKSLQGTLTADLPISSSFDSTVLAIDSTESFLAMGSSTTDADSIDLRAMAKVGDELLAYGPVTPGVGTFDSNLTYLNRGAYNTLISDHPAGTPMNLLDPNRLFVYSLPPSYVGVTIYFKFPSANIFGNSAQTLDECTAYTYTPAGVAYTVQPPTNVVLTYASDVPAQVTWTPTTDVNCTEQEIQYSLDGGYSWGVSQFLPASEASITPSIPGTQNLYNMLARIRSLGQYTAVSSWAVSIPATGPITPSINPFAAFGSAAVISINPATYIDPTINEIACFRGTATGTVTATYPYASGFTPPPISSCTSLGTQTITSTPGGPSGGPYNLFLDTHPPTAPSVGSVGTLAFYYLIAYNSIGAGAVSPVSDPYAVGLH
jgi:hypothetical protein